MASGETFFEFVQRHSEMSHVRHFIDDILDRLPTTRRLNAVRRMKAPRKRPEFIDVLFELFITSHIIDCEFVVADHERADVYVPGEFAVEATVCHRPKHSASDSETALISELRDRFDTGDPLGALFTFSSKGSLKNSDGISPKNLEKAIRKQAATFLATGEEQQRYLRPDEAWRNQWHYTEPVTEYIYESEDWSLWISWMTRTTKGRGGWGAGPGISFVGSQWQDPFRGKLKAKARQVSKWELDVPVYLAVGFGGFFSGGECRAVQDVWQKESGKQFCGLWVTDFALSPLLGSPALELIPSTQGEAPRESELKIPRVGVDI
ncbi:MAG: hypothetical protein OXJ54_16975 [Gemmatimonadetes bacterium]|nr:hypothetical protein [Candidatus Palauibacter rhopaloidicola]